MIEVSEISLDICNWLKFKYCLFQFSLIGQFYNSGDSPDSLDYHIYSLASHVFANFYLSVTVTNVKLKKLV